MSKESVVNALSAIHKKYGKESATTFNVDERVELDRISTGSLGLDIAIGGGYPVGRIIEIYGPESSGKTTLAIHAGVKVQENGGSVGFVDMEHAFDSFYAGSIGLNVNENFLFCQPDNGEQAFDMMEMMVKNGINLVILDSIAAMIPKAEVDGDYGDSKMGLQARLMSQGMRKMVSIVNKSNSTAVFINQLRDKIGVMFGSPETTSGGNAMKYAASIRLDVRRFGQEKDGDQVLANKTRVKVVKNKTHPPFKKAEFDIVFGQGIDTLGELVDLGVNFEIIKKSGSWYSYGDTKLGQGRTAAIEILKDNFELSEEIENEVINRANQ